MSKALAFPKDYEWLGTLGTLPKMVQVGLRLVGTLETPGALSNPEILSWAKELGCSDYTADSIPWCGLFMGKVALDAQKRFPWEDPDEMLWALNWQKFGSPSLRASLGDVLVFKRSSGGHVALYICEDKEHYYVLGGNQSDGVSIAPIEKSRRRACREPLYHNRPLSAKPYFRVMGGTVSTNEE